MPESLYSTRLPPHGSGPVERFSHELWHSFILTSGARGGKVPSHRGDKLSPRAPQNTPSVSVSVVSHTCPRRRIDQRGALWCSYLLRADQFHAQFPTYNRVKPPEMPPEMQEGGSVSRPSFRRSSSESDGLTGSSVNHDARANRSGWDHNCDSWYETDTSLRHSVNATHLRGYAPGFVVAIPTAPVIVLALE